jgi:hypothetical protein
MSIPRKSLLTFTTDDVDIFCSITQASVEIAHFYLTRHNGDIQKSTVEYLSKPKHHVLLPKEIIIHVCSYLPANFTLQIVKSVNTAWKDALSDGDAWKELCARDFSATKLLLEDWETDYKARWLMQKKGFLETVNLLPTKIVSHDALITVLYHARSDTAEIDFRRIFLPFLITSPYVKFSFHHHLDHDKDILTPLDSKSKGKVTVLHQDMQTPPKYVKSNVYILTFPLAGTQIRNTDSVPKDGKIILCGYIADNEVAKITSEEILALMLKWKAVAYFCHKVDKQEKNSKFVGDRDILHFAVTVSESYREVSPPEACLIN